MSLPIIWPPSMPMRTAILPCVWARRISSAVVASMRSLLCCWTFWRTMSIWSRACCIAGGPRVLPEMKMEKNCTLRPPSRMRGMSTWPSVSRFPRSKLPVSMRCGVSACVSRTMDEKCSFFACSAMSSAEAENAKKKPAHRQALTHKKAKTRRISSPQFANREESLPHQPANERLFPGVAVDGGNRFRQRNVFGARMDAVLRVGAILDATGAHNRCKALALVHRPRRVKVEQAHLADDRRSDKFAVPIHLRANFQAVSATDAIRKRVALLLNLRRDARPFAQIVSPVDRNPRLHALQAFEHHLPVNGKIAHQGEFRHRRDSNGLVELVHQRGTGHASLPVDEHGARAANFFQAIRIVGDGRGLFAVACHGVLGDVPQTNDDVHGRPPLQRKLFPVRWLLRPRLPFHLDDDWFSVSHRPSCGSGKNPLLRRDRKSVV